MTTSAKLLKQVQCAIARKHFWVTGVEINEQPGSNEHSRMFKTCSRCGVIDSEITDKINAPYANQ